MQNEIEIIVCMGSACFARGNQANLEFIENYVKVHNMDVAVIVGGSRCEGKCADGPNIFVNGTEYNKVDEKIIEEIFKKISEK